MQVCCKKQVLYPSKDNYIFLRNLLETTEYQILASFIPKGTYFLKWNWVSRLLQTYHN